VAVLALVAAMVPAAPGFAQAERAATIAILDPDPAGLPAVATQGDTVEVVFTTDRRSWTYAVSLRSADGDDTTPGGDATGTTVRGEQSAVVALPAGLAPGDHDLVVELLRPGQGPDRTVDQDVAEAAVQVLPSDPPTTGFEDRGGPERTTHDEELAFVDEVAALSPRVTVTEEARSLEDRPIQLARIGFPAPPSDDDIAAGRNLLVVAAQHGDEPAGREMTLEVLRDLAFTDDEVLLDQLADTTVLIVPTANPDGTVADTRGNADGIDPNRDHLGLRTVEGRTIAELMHRFTPDIVVDAHEGPSTPENPGQTPRLELAWPRNLNVDADVRELSATMIEDHVLAAADAAGYDTDVYGSPGGAGGGDERIMRNAIGLRHHLGMLIETFNATAVDRAELQVLAVEEVLRFHRDHTEQIVAAVEGAPDRRAADGAEREPFFVGGSDWETPADDEVLDPAPCGYVINTLQAEQLETQLDLFDVTSETVSDTGVFVTMAQPAMTVVPLLMDERASFNDVTGVALDDCSDPGAVDPPPLPDPPSEPGQWSTDLSDTEPGEVPEGWSELWRSSDWVVQDDPRVLRHTVGSGGGRRALVWDEVGDDGDGGVVRGDVEIAGLVRAEQVGETLVQIGLHYGGEAGSEQGYYLDARLPDAGTGANSVRIGRYLDGAFTGISTVGLPFTVSEDTWYHVVIQRDGELLRAKMWPDGEDEPDGWQASTSDTSFGEGRVGVAHFTAGTVNDWAFVGVGTGGEPAPRPGG
jgi:hypothetical protein